ncbi:hypothetical protein IFM89_023322 [Coptis chinensis]|uniref:MORF/ORRM1/DAG-like MORF domain-containing protein n=1 Tax=Coptis chinensis TaxID=261450 RepID=A0A835HUC8_9MAGN|nr:hypothetical protein IFM89_023322 [Coptis chinensis]
MALIATRRSLTTLITRTRTLAVSILNKNQNMIHDSRKIPSTPRFKTSGSGYSPLNDPSPNWSNRPPKETILLDGCDYEHWLIVMEFPAPSKPSEDEMVQSYVSTLSSVLGSEEEAKKKIYSVCTTTYTGFGALISEELSHKVKALPGVLWVLPDSYLDVPNKDYGGDLFEDGKVIRRPQYHYDQRQPAGHRACFSTSNQEPAAQYANQGPASQYDNQGPASQPAAMGGQNSLNTGERVPYPNQGNYSQGGA